MMPKLLNEIRRFVELQNLLITEFCRCYPQVKDSRTLHHAPRTGCLSTMEGLWLFRKHGAGICFLNAQGVEIDSHRAFGSPDLFDAWRIRIYLESASENGYPELSELEAILDELVGRGALSRCSDRLFRLAEPARVLPLVEEPSSATQGKADYSEAITRLVANGLYEIRLRLGTGRVEGMSPHIDIAARLAYALHNEALFLLGAPQEADLEGALRRIQAIDDAFPGEGLVRSFQRALSPAMSGREVEGD